MNNKSMDGIDGSRAAARPSLYTNNDAGNGDGTSILAGLDPDRSTFTARWSVVFWGGMAVLLTAILYWGIHSGAPKQQSSFSPLVASNSDLKNDQKIEVQSALKNNAASDALAEAESRAAIIVAESAVPGSELNTHGNGLQSSKIGSDPAFSALSEPSGPQQKNSVSGLGAVAPLIAEKKVSSALKTSANPTRKETRAVKPSNAQKTKEATRLATAAGSAKATGKDEDVDLIAALLLRVSGGNNNGKTANSKSKSQADPNTAKRENRNEINRDIIVRTPGESTESLVKRCQALGLFEGELCRTRICSGSWGRDPACLANTPLSINQ